MNRSLASLAARAQLGDRSALEALLRHLQGPLGHHIRGIVRDDDLTADVLQDTLVIVYRQLGTVRQTEWIRAWAYRVATREAYRAFRNARRDVGESLEVLPEMPNATDDDEEIDTELLLTELPSRLDALPRAAQVVLRLHYQQSMTQQEISEILEIPIGTVKSRIGYGLQWLRKSWTRGAP